MSVKNSLTICRILVALLIFNIAAPMAMAGTSDDNTILICSTAGLIEVNVSDLSDNQGTNHSELAQHCPFCTLSDSDYSMNADHLAYPKPDSEQALHYQSVLPLSPAKAITKHALLRAPPFSL